MSLRVSLTKRLAMGSVTGLTKNRKVKGEKNIGYCQKLMFERAFGNTYGFEGGKIMDKKLPASIKKKTLEILQAVEVGELPSPRKTVCEIDIFTDVEWVVGKLKKKAGELMKRKLKNLD